MSTSSLPPPDVETICAWEDAIEDSDYYELLGVLEIADTGAIKDAYHQFARAFHPDGYPLVDAALSTRLRRIFQRGVEAYRTLSDPQLRADYDMALARGALRLKDSRLPPEQLGGAKSLEDLCFSMSARLAARKADQLISCGKLIAAKEQLQMALRHEEGENEELTERLDALDLLLFAQGD
jgi:curved DNA-binding protein CbpA